MNTYYITFGIASIFGRYYLPIKAVSEEKAREFCKAHVPGWAFVYDEDRFAGKPLKYGLRAFPAIESQYFLHPDSTHGELAVPK
jgi:hypothetical protein